MSGITIRTRNSIIDGELDKSDISNEIWLKLPFSNTINMLGDEIYFEFPLDSNMNGERATVFDAGDIAYWPKVQALCLFFGPTPLSGEDGRPVSRFPLIKIGKMKGDFKVLETAGDRMKITIEQSL